MIKKRYLIVLSVAVISVLLGSLFVNNMILAQNGGGEYDPWLDFNEDGFIDVNDLSPLGRAYSSSGDPTKNVTVTNWPVSTDVTVWFKQYLSPSQWKYTGFYDASGFGYLHVLAIGEGVYDTEEVYLDVIGLLWETPPGPGTGIWILAYAVTLTATQNSLCVTIPVPSEKFLFSVKASPTTTAYVSLSFYLTWA